MIKKKKVFVFSVLLLLVFLFWGVKAYLDANKKIYLEKEPEVFDSIQVFDDQKFVMVSQKGRYGIRVFYGQDYVATVSEKTLYTGNMKTPPKIGDEEYFKIITYDLNTPNLFKREFDVYQLLGEENVYRATGSINYYYQNGTDYFVMPMTLIQYQEEGEQKLLFTARGELITDNSEERIEEFEKSNPGLTKEPIYKTVLDWSQGGISQQITDNLKEFGLAYTVGTIYPYRYEDIGCINLAGTNFAALYPEVAKKAKDLENLYFRPKQYTEKEWFDKLIHWFAPKGQDVMELYATDEKTGERTQIKSYHEFAAWVAAHPKEGETNE